MTTHENIQVIGGFSIIALIPTFLPAIWVCTPLAWKLFATNIVIIFTIRLIEFFIEHKKEKL